MKGSSFKAGIAAALVATSLLAAGTAFAQESEAAKVGTTQEVHISNNGKTLVRGAKVTAVSGSGFTATNIWGSASESWTVQTDGSTEFMRRYGGASSLSEISAGDIVSFSGNLDQTASAFSVKASVVKDWSVQKENSTVSGTVSSVTAASFLLHTANRGDVTVSLAASSTVMKDGSAIAFSDIKAGDRISSASGVLDNVNHTLVANKVVVYVNKALLEKRTFQGTLKSVAGTTLPTTLVVTVGSSDYTVNVPAGISVVNKNWLAITLDKFVVGNTIRFYGAPEVNSPMTVDATIVRDASI